MGDSSSDESDNNGDEARAIVRAVEQKLLPSMLETASGNTIRSLREENAALRTEINILNAQLEFQKQKYETVVDSLAKCVATGRRPSPDDDDDLPPAKQRATGAIPGNTR